MESQPSGSADVLSTTQSLVDCCIEGRQREQRVAANRLHELLANPLDLAPIHRHFGGSSYRIRGKGKSEEALDNTKALFKAIESAEDDLAVIVLCRLAETLISESSTSKRASRRHRRLVKVDACSSIIRALRGRFRLTGHTSPLAASATDAIAVLLLAVGTKDPRITLKIRVGALIQPLCVVVARAPPSEVSAILLRLLCRAVRSPRNGQLCGRQKDFPAALEAKIQELAAGNGDLAQLAQIRLARYMEILYFITKNKKTRVQLIQDDVVHRTLTVFRHQVELRRTLRSQGNEDSVATEICLVVIALLRLLSNNKKAKEQLVDLGAIEMSEKVLTALATENSANPNLRQLQDSLCSLCLRCLPSAQFPVADHSFPFRCPLPRSLSPSKRRSVSKSPMKGPPALSPLKKIDEDAVSSDDGMDEEDEVFLSLDESRLPKSDGEDEQDEGGSRRLSHSKLKSTELAEYDPLFCELRHSAEASVPLSWTGYEDTFLRNAQGTSSVVPFVKIAFPEINNPDVDLPKQPLSLNKDSMNQMVVQHLARTRSRAQFKERVVFDLDELYAGCGPRKSKVPSEPLKCDDVSRVGRIDTTKDHLEFESRFECGNLRRATQVFPNHYELVLSPDINQVGHHYQWFYFEVSNIRANVDYTFEIVNCLKSTSMYSKGMQPVMYSVQDAMKGNGGWKRAGEGVCYYRNLYTSNPQTNDMEQESADGEKGGKKRNFYSIRFNVTFLHQGDICYLAYHFPYTFSYMKTSLEHCLSRLRSSVYTRIDTIATSLGGNPVQMLTVTGPGSSSDLVTRDVVVISARVHPGESNASWMMHGILEQLLCSASAENSALLSHFVFKVIPMLNPDGVINGSHRCSLAGVDLNRVWDKPSQGLHPEIYHSKAVIQYMVDVLGHTPFLFVDLHGHSRRSNVFLFGNNPEESYRSLDKMMPHNWEYLGLPEFLEEISPSFSFKNCQFNITRGKESSARVTIWRQFGILRSYTMESTYCGFESGAYRGFQIGTSELKEMGQHLLSAIQAVKIAAGAKPRSTPKKASPTQKDGSPSLQFPFRELGE